ncbi:MAG: ATP-binding cassette, subfamily bacterial RamB/AmfA [Solirubrobacteraceae bacterium]|jgi:ATP-binding cassette subfamily C protein|nr:ATP-binding cassette, subfamily bacterial RamB/AmfA [Solirubrobacteraceae bacterium]
MTRAMRRAAMGRLLRSSVRGRGPEVRRLAAWSLVQALPAFLSGLLVARAIDDGFLDGRTTTGVAWLGLLAVSVLAGGWATRQTFLRLAAVVEPFRDELVRRTVHGSLRRSSATGAAPDSAGVARLTQQVEIVREAYASVLLVVQGFVVTAVGALLGLLTLAPVVLVLVVPPLVLGLALFAFALPGMAARQRASILADERIAARAATVADGLRDVTACGAEKQVRRMVGEHIDAQARATRELARFTALRTVAVAVGGLLPVVLILAEGRWLLDHGASTGAILGALTYVAQGVHPALQTLVRGLGNTGLWLFVTLARIVEETEDAEDGPAPASAGSAGPRGYAIALREVTFGYGRATQPVIVGLDLAIGEGDHLAVVGPSGGGKSTLAGLIAGLLEPQHGAVLLGGQPVAALDVATAARQRVLIPQQAYVFAGTVRENLAYMRPDAGDALLDDAVARLGARALVDRLGGYGAALDPSALSGGERQLLTLVRAYVAEAPVVILDEATCHLDPASEARVERAFAERGGTLLVIAHRISSALRARRVLVLDGGQALVGSHDELRRRSVLYRELVGHWDGPRRVVTNGDHDVPRGLLARVGRALAGLRA